MNPRSRPLVAALAGRRIDVPNSPPRFPLQSVDHVRAQLEQLFETERVGFLVCSAACGADLIALEIAREKAIHFKIVLPFPVEQFRQFSVVDRPGNWGAVFDEIINSIPSTDLTVLHTVADVNDAYEAATREIVRQATAAAAPSKALAIAVWEGKGRQGTDATASFLRHAHRVGMNTRTVSTC